MPLDENCDRLQILPEHAHRIRDLIEQRGCGTGVLPCLADVAADHAYELETNQSFGEGRLLSERGREVAGPLQQGQGCVRRSVAMEEPPPRGSLAHISSRSRSRLSG